MKAATYKEYGPPEVLEIKDVDKPTPKDNDILVKAKYANVTAADSRIRSSNIPKGFWLPMRLFFGLFRPRQQILGSGFSGVVEQVGDNVKDFEVGQEVFGTTGTNFGAYAEYLTIAQDKSVTKKPSGISHQQAAALSFGGNTALCFLRDKAKLQQGQSVLINGASGSVGTSAVQIAKHYGAHVTAITSTSNIELVESIGADEVIDYKKDDVLGTSEKYDIIFDVVGNIEFEKWLPLLKENGKLLLAVASLPDMLKAAIKSIKLKDKSIISGDARDNKKDLGFLAKLAVESSILPVIDREYELEDIVEAHKLVDSGRKKGNIVIKID